MVGFASADKEILPKLYRTQSDSKCFTQIFDEILGLNS